jgi:hypothetical protein
MPWLLRGLYRLSDAVAHLVGVHQRLEEHPGVNPMKERLGRRRNPARVRLPRRDLD